jgi:hypothetical protein
MNPNLPQPSSTRAETLLVGLIYLALAAGYWFLAAVLH